MEQSTPPLPGLVTMFSSIPQKDSTPLYMQDALGDMNGNITTQSLSQLTQIFNDIQSQSINQCTRTQGFDATLHKCESKVSDSMLNVSSQLRVVHDPGSSISTVMTPVVNSKIMSDQTNSLHTASSTMTPMVISKTMDTQFPNRFQPLECVESRQTRRKSHLQTRNIQDNTNHNPLRDSVNNDIYTTTNASDDDPVITQYINTDIDLHLMHESMGSMDQTSDMMFLTSDSPSCQGMPVNSDSKPEMIHYDQSLELEGHCTVKHEPHISGYPTKHSCVSDEPTYDIHREIEQENQPGPDINLVLKKKLLQKINSKEHLSKVISSDTKVYKRHNYSNDSYYGLDTQDLCACLDTIDREEVPEEQVFIVQGQMYRLQDAFLVCVGHCQVHAFLKDGSFFIPQTLLMTCFNLETQRRFKRALKKHQSSLTFADMMENDCELIRQKYDILKSKNFVKYMIEYSCIRAVADLVLKAIDNPILDSLVNKPLIVKQTTSQVKCSQCGSRILRPKQVDSFIQLDINYIQLKDNQNKGKHMNKKPSVSRAGFKNSRFHLQRQCIQNDGGIKLDVRGRDGVSDLENMDQLVIYHEADTSTNGESLQICHNSNPSFAIKHPVLQGSVKKEPQNSQPLEKMKEPVTQNKVISEHDQVQVTDATNTSKEKQKNNLNHGCEIAENVENLSYKSPISTPMFLSIGQEYIVQDMEAFNIAIAQGQIQMMKRNPLEQTNSDDKIPEVLPTEENMDTSVDVMFHKCQTRNDVNMNSEDNGNESNHRGLVDNETQSNVSVIVKIEINSQEDIEGTPGCFWNSASQADDCLEEDPDKVSLASNNTTQCILTPGEEYIIQDMEAFQIAKGQIQVAYRGQSEQMDQECRDRTLDCLAKPDIVETNTNPLRESESNQICVQESSETSEVSLPPNTEYIGQDFNVFKIDKADGNIQGVHENFGDQKKPSMKSVKDKMRDKILSKTKQISINQKISEKDKEHPTLTSLLLKEVNVSKLTEDTQVKTPVNCQPIVTQPRSGITSGHQQSPIKTLHSSAHSVNKSPSKNLPLDSSVMGKSPVKDSNVTLRVEKMCSKIASLMVPSENSDTVTPLNMLATIATVDESDAESRESWDTREMATKYGKFSYSEEDHRTMEEKIKKFIVFVPRRNVLIVKRFKDGADKAFPALFSPHPDHPIAKELRRKFSAAVSSWMTAKFSHVKGKKQTGVGETEQIGNKEGSLIETSMDIVRNSDGRSGLTTNQDKPHVADSNAADKLHHGLKKISEESLQSHEQSSFNNANLHSQRQTTVSDASLHDHKQTKIDNESSIVHKQTKMDNESSKDHKQTTMDNERSKCEKQTVRCESLQGLKETSVCDESLQITKQKPMNKESSSSKTTKTQKSVVETSVMGDRQKKLKKAKKENTHGKGNHSMNEEILQSNGQKSVNFTQESLDKDRLKRDRQRLAYEEKLSSDGYLSANEKCLSTENDESIKDDRLNLFDNSLPAKRPKSVNKVKISFKSGEGHCLVDFDPVVTPYPKGSPKKMEESLLKRKALNVPCFVRLKRLKFIDEVLGKF